MSDTEFGSLARFHASKGAAVLATANRVRDLIGDAHWLSDGTYKESLIRNAIRDVVPSSYTVGHGFMVTPSFTDFDRPVVSKQMDILIYDERALAPVFRDGDFAIVISTEVLAAIEVKSRWANTGAEYKESLDNLSEAAEMKHRATGGKSELDLISVALCFKNEFLPKKKGRVVEDDPVKIARKTRKYIHSLLVPREDETKYVGPMVPSIVCPLDSPWCLISGLEKVKHRGHKMRIPVLWKVNTRVENDGGEVFNHSLHFLLSLLQGLCISAQRNQGRVEPSLDLVDKYSTMWNQHRDHFRVVPPYALVENASKWNWLGDWIFK